MFFIGQEGAFIMVTGKIAGVVFEITSLKELVDFVKAHIADYMGLEAEYLELTDTFVNLGFEEDLLRECVYSIELDNIDVNEIDSRIKVTNKLGKLVKLIARDTGIED